MCCTMCDNDLVSGIHDGLTNIRPRCQCFHVLQSELVCKNLIFKILRSKKNTCMKYNILLLVLKALKLFRMDQTINKSMYEMMEDSNNFSIMQIYTGEVSCTTSRFVISNSLTFGAKTRFGFSQFLQSLSFFTLKRSRLALDLVKNGVAEVFFFFIIIIILSRLLVLVSLLCENVNFIIIL